MLMLDIDEYWITNNYKHANNEQTNVLPEVLANTERIFPSFCGFKFSRRNLLDGALPSSKQIINEDLKNLYYYDRNVGSLGLSKSLVKTDATLWLHVHSFTCLRGYSAADENPAFTQDRNLIIDPSEMASEHFAKLDVLFHTFLQESFLDGKIDYRKRLKRQQMQALTAVHRLVPSIEFLNENSPLTAMTTDKAQGTSIGERTSWNDKLKLYQVFIDGRLAPGYADSKLYNGTAKSLEIYQ